MTLTCVRWGVVRVCDRSRYATDHHMYRTHVHIVSCTCVRYITSIASHRSPHLSHTRTTHTRTTSHLRSFFHNTSWHILCVTHIHTHPPHICTCPHLSHTRTTSRLHSISLSHDVWVTHNMWHTHTTSHFHHISLPISLFFTYLWYVNTCVVMCSDANEKQYVCDTHHASHTHKTCVTHTISCSRTHLTTFLSHTHTSMSYTHLPSPLHHIPPSHTYMSISYTHTPSHLHHTTPSHTPILLRTKRV